MCYASAVCVEAVSCAVADGAVRDSYGGVGEIEVGVVADAAAVLDGDIVKDGACVGCGEGAFDADVVPPAFLRRRARKENGLLGCSDGSERAENTQPGILREAHLHARLDRQPDAWADIDVNGDFIGAGRERPGRIRDDIQRDGCRDCLRLNRRAFLRVTARARDEHEGQSEQERSGTACTLEVRVYESRVRGH